MFAPPYAESSFAAGHSALGETGIWQPAVKSLPKAREILGF